MYQETNGIDADSFPSFPFPQQNEDGDGSLPLVDNLLQQPPLPPGDHRAASEFLKAIDTLTVDLRNFQESLSFIHTML